MSRPIKPPRPYPADWRTNTLAARGWAGAIALAGAYGWISYALRQNGADL